MLPQCRNELVFPPEKFSCPRISTGLPDLHRDPLDRILVAQAQCEGLMLLTTDAIVARYPGPIRKV